MKSPSHFHSRVALLAHCGLAVMAFAVLFWTATHPEVVLGADRFARLPTDWQPSKPMVIVSLLGVALMPLTTRWPVIGLIAFVAVGYGFPRRESFEFFCRWHVTEAISLLSFTGWLVWRQRKPAVSREWSKPGLYLLWIMAGLVGWVLITTAVAWTRGDYRPAYNHHPIHMVSSLLLMVVAGGCLRSPGAWWCFSMSVAITLCLRTGLAPEYLRLNGDLGVLLAIGVPLAVLALLAWRRWIPQMVALGAISFQLLSLFKTENRGGAVALAAASVTAWLLCRRKVPILIVVVPLILSVTGYFSQTHYWGRMESIWKGGPSRASVDSRYVIYDAGWKMALDNPLFGVGLGNFQPRMSEYSQNGKADSPHNHVVAMLAETGFLGAGLFIALFCYAIGVAMVVARRYPAGAEHWIAVLLASALVAYLVGGSFMTRHTLELAYIMVGGAVAVSAPVRRTTEAPSGVNDRRDGVTAG